jgi:hypothetical protein
MWIRHLQEANIIVDFPALFICIPKQLAIDPDLGDRAEWRPTNSLRNKP